MRTGLCESPSKGATPFRLTIYGDQSVGSLAHGPVKAGGREQSPLIAPDAEMQQTRPLTVTTWS